MSETTAKRKARMQPEMDASLADVVQKMHRALDGRSGQQAVDEYRDAVRRHTKLSFLYCHGMRAWTPSA